MLENSYTNWVEVVDGRITFEDAGGWYSCCYIYQCDNINAMQIYRQSGPAVRGAPTWFPAMQDPYEQREFAAPRKISIVSMVAPDDECRHSWLMDGGAAKCLSSGGNKKQRASGWFESSTVVGVSNTPCTDGGCLKDAQICGYVDKSRNKAHHHVENFGHNVQRDAGQKNRYWVDCEGKEGKYVFVMAKGKERILAVEELYVNQLSPTSGDPEEFKDKFVCYPVEARTAAEHTPEYITTDDPEDPVFYSTCFMREREVVYLPREAGGTPKAMASFEFHGKCLPCDLYQKNRRYVLCAPPHVLHRRTPRCSFGPLSGVCCVVGWWDGGIVCL